MSRGLQTSNTPFTYTEVARELAKLARGERMPELYWEMSAAEFGGRLASGDDITVLVAPLKKAFRRAEWGARK